MVMDVGEGKQKTKKKEKKPTECRPADHGERDCVQTLECADKSTRMRCAQTQMLGWTRMRVKKHEK